MWSTRARLAAAYAGLLFATLAAFCIAVYFARRASTYPELGVRAQRAADQVLTAMATAEKSGKRLSVRDDSGRVSPLPELRTTLETRPGYFLVLDERNRLLYSSFAVRQLTAVDQGELNQVAVDLHPGRDAAVVPLADARMLLVARGDSTLRPNISRVIAALPTSDAEAPAQLLLGTLILLAPLFFLVS